MPAGVLHAMAVLSATRSGVDARLLEAAILVVSLTGRVLLAEKGFADVTELSEGQRKKWRAEAKRLARAEVEVRLGLGAMEAQQLVGVACAPEQVRELILGALDRGWVSWFQVRCFWTRCAKLPAESALLVAQSLFGTDPALMAKERLDPDGNPRDEPWAHATYRAALEREATRVEGQDVKAERERRRAAYAARRAGLSVHDDGTGTLTVTGPLLMMTAVHARIEAVARSLRKQGDPRTLDQLRVDVAGALLIHGLLPLPGQSDEEPANPDPDHELSTADLAQIARIVNAQPQVQVQVVVPWDVLTGRPACPPCGEKDEAAPPSATATATASAYASATASDESASDETASDVTASDETDPGAGSRLRGGVAEILGRFPAFTTPGHARELVLTPGATLVRLLTDPADGRLVERSISTYRPDAAMRRQVLAADVYCRAPGSRQPGAHLELDHVVPWGTPRGDTAEPNLVGLGKTAHQRKTDRRWIVTVNERRDLTWTTLLGQRARTRAHDYRQYLDLRAPVDDSSPSEVHPSQRVDLDDRRDVLNQALYAALAHREPGAALAGEDDAPGTGDHGGELAGWIWVTRPRRTPQGVETILTGEDDTATPEQTRQTARRNDDPPPF
ncbi:HNH endonuclease signature motif containing protein [Ornithinimicrobium tianjinense]|uniref:HNH endonuclease n=1 Tax=Ornithinimicrobium tianjinense TaxID=1195761 RepID=A0A917F893_9MICO|nr:HNH endonuclease signature motif containing protein [Ornithinimicrobium tianjinense]GGF52782.1 hypothetical protein GCM10011366_20720 [Ornithinimicrobium tianjinense]